MQFFLDTGSIDQIREASEYGLIDGVTTNPSLLVKEGVDWKKRVAEICEAVSGPVSIEVVGTTAEEMVAEARELVKFGPNVVVKIPMLAEGMKAVSALKRMDIPTNVTLVFSPMQALMAAKAGATYVSPFVGRLDALSHNGMEMVGQIVDIFRNYDMETKVLVASVRHVGHVLDSALLGADCITVPFSVIMQLMKHPLTDSGLKAFLDDWKNVKG